MEYEFFNLHRMFLGDELPWTFLFEVVFRTAFLYAYSFLCLRLVSRRAVGSLTAAEVLLIVALGSAVGDPMFYADVPLLHGMVVITTVIVMTQGFGALTRRSERIENLASGGAERVVSAARLDLEGIGKAGLSHDEVYQALRMERIEHLGEVRVAYVEQNGSFSVYRYAEVNERPGLRIEPPETLVDTEPFTEGLCPESGDWGCWACGDLTEFGQGDPIRECLNGHREWTRRVFHTRTAEAFSGE